MRYLFDPFVLDAERQELRRDGEVVPIEPQVFALLELLIANPHRVIGKEELNERVWGGRPVTDAAVNSRIRSARAALGDDGAAQRFIRTVRGRGFRFVADVETAALVEVQQQEAAPIAVDPRQVADSPPAIAVMPLALLSLDTRYEPLADAIAHEVTADLSRLHWLRVISRASTFKLRHGVEPEEVARILAVDYLLTGSLAIFGDHAATTIELMDMRTREVIWADRQSSSLADLIGLRSELSSRIANVIEMRIQVQEAGPESPVNTEHLDAWTCYFRGLRHAHRFNRHDNDTAMHLFERAARLDPQFALAQAGLSFTHFQAAFVGYSGDYEGSKHKAMQCAERGYELDPLDPVVNLTVGRARFLNGEGEQANGWFQRSAQLSPSNALAYYNQALVGATTGSVAGIEEMVAKALSLSPIDPLRYAFLATPALDLLTRGDAQGALPWALRGSAAPRAHHLIDAITALAAYGVGDAQLLARWKERLQQRAPNFRVEHFFRAFPVRESARRDFQQAFKQMGFR